MSYFHEDQGLTPKSIASVPMAPVEVQPFEFEGRAVRVIELDDDIWFVASDVAAELGYSHTPHLLRHMDDDEKGVHIVDTPGGDQQMAVISEPGLYRAIMQRRTTKRMDEVLKARLARFDRWVFHDVLPSIRKTGGYGQPQLKVSDLLAQPDQLLALANGFAAQVIEQRQQIAVLQEDANALDRLAGADELFGVRLASKLLQMPQNTFTRYLQQIGWAYRQNGTKQLLAYSTKQKVGYVFNKVDMYTKPDGSDGVRETLKITGKGLVCLAKMLGKELLEGDLIDIARSANAW